MTRQRTMRVRRGAMVAAAILMAWAYLLPGRVEARPLHVTTVNLPSRVDLACSIGNPPISYSRGGCGVNQGKTVYLRAAANEVLPPGYQIWIVGKQIQPHPGTLAKVKVCVITPCMSKRSIRQGLSTTSVVGYEYQAWLVHQPVLVNKSITLRVAWAPASLVVGLTVVNTVGKVTTVHLRMIQGDLEQGVQYLDLRILDGPGQGTTIGHCKFDFRGGSANSCDLPVDCSRYSSAITVQARVVNEAEKKVDATSDSLTLCQPPAPTQKYAIEYSISGGAGDCSPAPPQGYSSCHPPAGGSVQLSAKVNVIDASGLSKPAPSLPAGYQIKWHSNPSLASLPTCAAGSATCTVTVRDPGSGNRAVDFWAQVEDSSGSLLAYWTLKLTVFWK